MWSSSIARWQCKARKVFDWITKNWIWVEFVESLLKLMVELVDSGLLYQPNPQKFKFMRKKLLNEKTISAVWRNPRSKIRPPPPAEAVIRVSNHVAHFGLRKEGPKPRQLLSLPPFPGHPLPGRKSTSAEHVTAISWLKYYFDDIPPPQIQHHFNKGLVSILTSLFCLLLP